MDEALQLAALQADVQRFIVLRAIVPDPGAARGAIFLKAAARSFNSAIGEDDFIALARDAWRSAR